MSEPTWGDVERDFGHYQAPPPNQPRTVCLSVDLTDDGELPRVLEVLARYMAGLVLEDIDARLWTYQEATE